MKVAAGESTPKPDVGKAVELGKSDACKVMSHAVNQLRLAVAEVRVVQRRKDGKLLEERVVNKDALARAAKRLRQAEHAVETVAAAEIEPVAAGRARAWLIDLKRELERLKGLA